MIVSFESVFFFFKQKTAYEMRIRDWSSDVCSSDLRTPATIRTTRRLRAKTRRRTCVRNDTSPPERVGRPPEVRRRHQRAARARHDRADRARPVGALRPASDPVAERFEAPKRRIVDPALGLDPPGDGSVRRAGIGLAVAGAPGHLDCELRVLARWEGHNV